MQLNQKLTTRVTSFFASARRPVSVICSREIAHVLHFQIIIACSRPLIASLAYKL